MENNSETIKLVVEIKNGRFNYSYEVGDSKHSSSSHLCADFLCAFTSLLKYCSDATHYDSKEKDQELWARVWMEKHPDEARKLFEEKHGHK